MIRHIFKYSLLLAIIFAFASCDKQIYDKQADDDKNQAREAVFLSVTRDKVSKFRSSPDLPGDPTINQDIDDWEDRVNSLALLVFDEDGNKIAEHIDDAGNGAAGENFVIKLYPGKLDFYFVANMPNMSTALSSITKVSGTGGMEEYMSNLYVLSADLYSGAKTDKGFPMSRVYKEQTVVKGGTVYQPAPFLPKNDYGLSEGKVLLIRVVAKLEVKVLESEASSIQNVILKNAFDKFHLQHGLVKTENVDGTPSSVAQSTNTPHSLITHVGDVTLQESLPTGGYVTYTAYMPEALMSGAKWTDTDHIPINYFVIKTTSGVDFEIPIITSSDMGWTDNYLTYAKNDNNPKKYNIYRNRRYFYEVKNLSDIEIQYNVKEWEQVKRQLFMGYGYNVIIDENGEITIENTIDDCMPHKVTLKALNGAYFGSDSDNTTIEYGYLSASDTGYSLEKTKAGYSESFGILNNESVPSGQPYLEIYYNLDGEGNPILVKTYTK